jgi:Ulp1 family protease
MKNFNIIEWEIFIGKSPIQKDSYNCGVFCILNADYLSDNLPLNYVLNKDNSDEYRLMIAASIFRGYINY